MALIKESASHWHAPGVSQWAAGTVFWRSEYSPSSSMELHARAPYATVYDLVRGGLVAAREGGAVADLPNHLARLVLWNFENTGQPAANYSFWLRKNWGRVVKPIVVGFHGAATTFDDRTLGVLESLGTPVQPASLFEAQLLLRLGMLPDWMATARADWAMLLPRLEAVKPAAITSGTTAR